MSTQSSQVAERRRTIIDLAQSHGWKVAELRVPPTVAGHSGGRGVKRNELTVLIDAVLSLLDVTPDRAAALVQPSDRDVWSARLKRAARHLMSIDKTIQETTNA